MLDADTRGFGLVGADKSQTAGVSVGPAPGVGVSAGPVSPLSQDRPLHTGA